MGGWYMEECCYWWIDNKRDLSMWLYRIWWRNFKFTFKITRKNQETQSSRGGNSRSKPHEEVELSQNCTANVNENDDGV